MGNLFGTGQGKTVSTQAVRANGMQVQASSYGQGLPIVYGRMRIPGTLIWYGDFQSVEHDQQVGKGGSGGQNVSYTYSSSFQLALCESDGTLTLGQIWQDSSLVSLSDINGTFGAGGGSQAAWSHLSSPDNLQYPFTAWIGCVNLKLGSSPNVPNYNFEINGLLQYAPTGSPAIYDAEPSAIVNDLMTSTTHGIGFQYLGDLTTFKDYCVASGIFLSLVVDQETALTDVLTNLLQITNSNTAWSNGKLIIIPYGDESVTGNGVTYTPPTTVRASFTDADYVKPVKIERKPLADRYNVIRVEWVDPTNNYVTSVAEAKDESDISSSIVRQSQTIQAHSITNAQLAQQTAQRILQRALYIRNVYTFTTTLQYVALEPGDVVELSDSLAELVNEPVRITKIAEQGNNELEITCEEFPAGVSEGATQSVEAAAGYKPNFNGAPDTTQPPVIFRAPQFLVDGDVEVWIGACGSGANWGGANVLVSYDNVTYTKIGSIKPGCRYGTLTAALADSATDPDTTDSFSVALEGPGSLSGGTNAEADNLATLTLVDQELLAYSSTVLNGDGTYTLGNGYMRRQCYQTAHAAHAIGAPWMRVDDNIFRWKVDPSLVGTTVYIKLQAWNLYGGGLESESSLTAITYVIGTAEEIPDTPPVPTNFIVSGAANGNLLTWDNTNPAAVAITSVEYSTTGTSGWSVLGQVQGTHYAHVFSGNATYYYRARARSPSFIWSAYTSTVSTEGGSIDYAPDGLAFQRMVLGANLTGDCPYNGDFEQWADGQSVPDGWVSAGPQVYASRSTTAFTGAYSLSLAPNSSSGVAGRPFGVEPGRRYKGSIWLYSSAAASAGAYFRVAWFADDTSLIIGGSGYITYQDMASDVSVSSANTWQNFTAFCQAPANAKYGRIFLYNVSATATFLFDRVSIPPYTNGKFLLQNNGNVPAWVHVGTLVLNAAGSATFTWHTGAGYNTNANQQSILKVTVRAGNDMAAPNLSGANAIVEGATNPLNATSNQVLFVASGDSTAANNHSWEVYFAVAPFTFGPLEVVVSNEWGDSFAFDGSGTAAPSTPASTYIYAHQAWYLNPVLGSGMDGIYDGTNFIRMNTPPAASAAATVTLSNSGTATAINVSAGTYYLGNVTVNTNTGSVDPGAYGTYYVYCDNPGWTGGAVTYQWTTDPQVMSKAPFRLYAGKITTVAGTSGSGGIGPQPCFSGDTRILTTTGYVRFDELPERFELINRTGRHWARLLVHERSVEPMRFMGPHLVTESHLIAVGDGWVKARLLFSAKAPVKPRTVYNAHVETDRDEDRHYLLENGLAAHNVKP